MSQVSLLKRKINIAILLLAASFSAHAQFDSSKSSRKVYPLDKVSFGMGTGLDYGGLGMNLTVYLQQNIGLFGGVGYALTGIGYNAGMKIRATFNDRKPNPSIYVLGMYGYNTVYKIKGASQLNKTFYGPSIGFGLETPVKPNRVGMWSFAIIVPLRSTEALKYYDDLKARPDVTINNELLPVAFSIGYKIIMH